MKKLLLLLLLLPSICLAQDYVFLVNKTTNVVTDIMSYTLNNEATLLERDSQVYDVVTKDLTKAQLVLIYKKYVNNDVVLNQDKVDGIATEDEDFSKRMNKINYAFALVVLDEINKLRVKNGDTPYNEQQLINVVRAKFKTL